MSIISRKVVRRYLNMTSQDGKAVTKSYGGSGEFELPDTHKAAIVVPKGGSCCANCQYGSMQEDGPHCSNEYWIKWNGGESRLPVDDPETYCSDWYEPGAV